MITKAKCCGAGARLYPKIPGHNLTSRQLQFVHDFALLLLGSSHSPASTQHLFFCQGRQERRMHIKKLLYISHWRGVASTQSLASNRKPHSRQSVRLSFSKMYTVTVCEYSAWIAGLCFRPRCIELTLATSRPDNQPKGRN